MCLSIEYRVSLLVARIARDRAASTDVGMSFGPRELLIADDNARNADRGIHVFQFGAYGCTYVLAFGHLEDALEDAAAALKEKAPGMFVEPEYDMERLASASDDEQAVILEKAEEDLTYTESGYLASWEWSVLTFDTLAEVRAYAANKA